MFNANAPVRRAAAILAMALSVAACAPTLRMTVETRDGAGQLVERFQLTNSDQNPQPGSLTSIQQINVSVSAEHSAGIQALWFEAVMNCYSHPDANGTATFNPIAVRKDAPANVTSVRPRQASFNDVLPLGPNCAGPGTSITLRGGATSGPTGRGGPVTTMTPGVTRTRP